MIKNPEKSRQVEVGQEVGAFLARARNSLVQAKAHVGSQRQVKVGTFEGMPRWSGGGALWCETNSSGVGEELLLARLVEQYVKSCVTCQQNRVQFRKEARLLKPLPIATKCWKSVSMDFMSHS